jgi:hypothetical protein
MIRAPCQCHSPGLARGSSRSRSSSRWLAATRRAAGLAIAITGALGPATWAAASKTTTALHAE